MSVTSTRVDNVAVIRIERPAQRNAVDRQPARMLADSFRAFDADETLPVAILTGAQGHFCAGADLKAYAAGDRRAIEDDGDGPMGPTRMRLSKPVIAAVELRLAPPPSAKARGVTAESAVPKFRLTLQRLPLRIPPMKNAITFHSATRGIHLRGAGVANLRIRGGECVLASVMAIAVDASVNATG